MHFLFVFIDDLGGLNFGNLFPMGWGVSIITNILFYSWKKIPNQIKNKKMFLRTVFLFCFNLFNPCPHLILIRDDDHDKSDEDDEEGRIDFAVNREARERQKMKDEFLAAEHGK